MQTLHIVGSGGEPVTLHGEGFDSTAPLLILVPGFKGFATWGFWPWLASELHAAGFATASVDFSHNGVRERDYDRLDLFQRDTWSRHQQDLDAVLARFSGRTIGLVGHSRGGGDALLLAARHPSIAAIAALAPVSRTLPDWPDVAETIARLGHYPIENTRTKQWMPVGGDFFSDAPRHDIVAAARAFAPRPLLCLHGDADTSVPRSCSDDIVRAHGRAELEILPSANHVFGATHPFRGPSRELLRISDAVRTFMSRELLR